MSIRLVTGRSCLGKLPSFVLHNIAMCLKLFCHTNSLFSLLIINIGWVVSLLSFKLAEYDLHKPSMFSNLISQKLTLFKLYKCRPPDMVHIVISKLVRCYFNRYCSICSQVHEHLQGFPHRDIWLNLWEV